MGRSVARRNPAHVTHVIPKVKLCVLTMFEVCHSKGLFVPYLAFFWPDMKVWSYTGSYNIPPEYIDSIYI